MCEKNSKPFRFAVKKTLALSMDDDWPAAVRAKALIENAFLELHIHSTVDHIMERIRDCHSIPDWEIIFVGSGTYLLPEMKLIEKLVSKNILVKKVHFIDIVYHVENPLKNRVKNIIEVAFTKSFPKFDYEISNRFPPGLTWQANGRLVLAFSKFTDWANTFGNIAHFLTKNWTYVQRYCLDKNVAFIDLFFHINPGTEELNIDSFSDLTQPSKVPWFATQGLTWSDMWTNYVKDMIHPDLRSGVGPMLGTDYTSYCAQYGVITPDEARDSALDLCKLCGTKESKKRRSAD